MTETLLNNSWQLPLKNGNTWNHFDRHDPATSEKFKAFGIPKILRLALLADETHPRILEYQNYLMVILRGVNLNPGASPDDMVSIRCLIQKDRVITTTLRSVKAIQDIKEAIEPPEDPSEFIVVLTEKLLDNMGGVLVNIVDLVDELEEDVLEPKNTDVQGRLLSLRRQLVHMHRYLNPQKESMTALYRKLPDWFSKGYEARLGEISDKLFHITENIELARTKASLIGEEIQNQNNARVGRTLYLLSLVTAVFLPLGLFAGMLGMNLGGIPFADDPSGFKFISLIFGVYIVIVLMLFRWIKWI